MSVFAVASGIIDRDPTKGSVATEPALSDEMYRDFRNLADILTFQDISPRSANSTEITFERSDPDATMNVIQNATLTLSSIILRRGFQIEVYQCIPMDEGVPLADQYKAYYDQWHGTIHS